MRLRDNTWMDCISGVSVVYRKRCMVTNLERMGTDSMKGTKVLTLGAGRD